MIWYPYTQQKNMTPPIHITKAEGIYLYEGEKKYIDTTSSWWSVIHGYNHPELNKALHRQIDIFSHVMLGGLTHSPALKLAEKLACMLPEDLNHCFFSDSGSVAVEVSLKMAIQYFHNKGQQEKKCVLALENAYHGDTFKAMAVGDDPDYHQAFPDKSNVYHVSVNKQALTQVFETHHHTLAAFIVEPLLQGAGGMKMYDVDFLIHAKALCQQYNVVLIFDEVATGFGRTGHRFVADCVTPDILVLGKALTAGYLGHAVTVSNQKIYDGFYSDSNEDAFMHGPTFMGNPLACTVALKSIEIFERDDYLTKIHNIEKTLKSLFNTYKHEAIKEIRILGACLCIEVHHSDDLIGFKAFALERGIHARPFLSYMYAMFPYIIDEIALRKVCQVYIEWFERKNL